MTVTYYYDAKYEAAVIENVEPENDGLCEKAMFYGPDARHMAWSFARSYYGTNCAALTVAEREGAADTEEQDNAPPSLTPKACPFCGSPARTFKWEAKVTGREFFRTACDADNPPGCDAEPFVDGETEAEAIAAWNRRSPVAPVQAEVERLRALNADLLEALKEIAALGMGRGDGAVGDYVEGVQDIAHAAITKAERPKASPYPFCDTSKCPHWKGYCRRDPACND